MIRVFVLSTIFLTVTFAASSAWAEHHEAGEAGAEAASVAAPAPTPWDQAKVAELARGIQNGARELRESERAKPPENLASGQASVRMRYMDKLRLAATESRRLADNVEKGQGREDTIQSFRRVHELLRDTTEEARRMFLPQATLDKIEAMSPQVDQLAGFYGVKVDPRPPLHGPSKDE